MTMVLALYYGYSTSVILWLWYQRYIMAMVLAVYYGYGTSVILWLWYQRYIMAMVLALYYGYGTSVILWQWYQRYIMAMVLALYYGYGTMVYGHGVQRHFQQYFSYIMAGQFYWWRKAEYLEKTTDLPQVTDKCIT